MKSALSLLKSRKFWLTAISTASAISMYRAHVIDGGQLATALQVAGAALVIAISHEDNGKNQATTNVATTGDVSVNK